MMALTVRLAVLLLVLLLLIVSPKAVGGYLQEDERDYLNHFDAHMVSSYAAGDHSETLNPCRRASPDFVAGNAITVRRVLSSSSSSSSSNQNKIPSSEVQQQCHKAYLCIIPPSLTVQMTSSLHVGALEIQGNVVWTDETQSQREAYLCAGYIVTSEGGSFSMNIQSATKRAWIYLVANGAVHERLGWRAFGGVGASSIDLVGRHLQRTWTLLDQPLQVGSSTLKLLHDPIAMGWKVGDRIGIAPTEVQSKGTGQTFTIRRLTSDGTVSLDEPSLYYHKAEFMMASRRTLLDVNMPPILMSAEVVNLSRNIVLTGDDFTNIRCNPRLKDGADGCLCTDYRKTCTVGLHTAMVETGVMRISNTRVEKCGQRGILGKYCLHLHKLRDCPRCLLSGNAIESSQQRGIVIHGTHRSLVERNVLWNVRGAGMYVEAGNEMYNSLEYNVVVCPYPLDDPIQHGCTIPGTLVGSPDDRRNQAGFYLKSSTNSLIGNRAANSRNGMFAESGVDGDAKGKVCQYSTAIGRWEGNTFHGHARFGTYLIQLYPQVTDRSLATNGFNRNEQPCNSFDRRGNTNGLSAAIVNHVDYDNIFVGQYHLGDVQYRGHVSLNNKNLIYWKETKNFEDSCAAHITESFYANGNLALPDQATIILQDTVLENVSLEANHHCKVGTTGYLCMPQYIFHNVVWRNDDPDSKWMYFQTGDTEYGGIFSLIESGSWYLRRPISLPE